ncbi:MAG: HAMP domain-containing methyl-accepting chemotaxis protein [SAR324 cluster bacterium]|nr:HAMP domain-containing methyl-accepting chemotaxis protein [SAR324 cluster bacterium]
MENLSIKYKLFLGFATMALTLVIVVFTTMARVQTVVELSHRVATLRVPTSEASGEVLRGIQHALAGLRGWMLIENTKFKLDRAAAWDKQINPSIAFMEKVSVNWTNPKNKKRLAEVKQLMGQFARHQQTIEDIVHNSPEERERALKILSNDAAPIGEKLIEILEAMHKDQKELLKKDEEEVDSVVNSLVTLLWVLLAGGLSIAVLFGSINTKSINGPIKAVGAILPAMSQGDISRRLNLNRTDELGSMAKAIDAFADKLTEMINGITGNSRDMSDASETLLHSSAKVKEASADMESKAMVIATASEEVSANVSTVASAAEETAANITTVSSATAEIDATMKDMAGNISDVSSNLNDVTGSITSISNDITLASTSVAKVVVAIAEISENAVKAFKLTGSSSESANETLDAMKELGTASDEIGNVVRIIGSIASQTNMLALNATIESASAGAAGKGFAVVAGEVKTLAQQTSESNNQIGNLVAKIQSLMGKSLKSTQTAVDAIREVSEINQTISSTVEQQKMISEEVSGMLKTVATASVNSTESLKKANSMVQEVRGSFSEAAQATSESAKNLTEASAGIKEVARSSAEVSSAVGEVNKSIQDIRTSIADVSNEVQSTSDDAQKVARISDELTQKMAFFKTS